MDFGYIETVAALYVFNGLAAMLIVGAQNIIHSLKTEFSLPECVRPPSVGGLASAGSVLFSDRQ
ncbi:hypothetical protein [Paenibacillus naphthalenovorans]|uniref:hypothetical protein n=1 Tax=Paenibacillus naphthalenovorans TaxID=162209 RepID=UPI00088BB5AF|nr:hypothetical protein [Paenibacillus naphthalenovorans]GCL74204.1 hypothetical protein PN4B1_41500 [Paenibacillus naphthalenovorans]SDJ23496.1 hypothetical protein SAMN05421868_12120 [Paenibacillus naphthalenovorans]